MSELAATVRDKGRALASSDPALARNCFAQVDQAKGRFRDFLKFALDHYLANELARQMTRKRGGLCKLILLDFQATETRYRLGPADPLTPDQVYQRQWVLAVWPY